MKTCTKCLVEKPESEYQSRYDKRSKSKLFSRCRSCEAERVRIWAATHREALRARYKKHHDTYNSKEENAVKQKARRRTKDSIRSGKLKKMPCIVCQDTKVDAHHPDYNYPLYVVWLCRKHHSNLHNGKLG